MRQPVGVIVGKCGLETGWPMGVPITLFTVLYLQHTSKT
jgi:hypothetical protein